ncbi:MAG: hypothetical protein NVV59_16880 [Chitinophagaceae bacterium]|nr:hypothetical protein [Chitinophagaceae bacterium]
MKPVIALSYTNNEQKHENYVRWLKAADDIEVITLSVSSDNLADLRGCSGLVLSGVQMFILLFMERKRRIIPMPQKNLINIATNLKPQLF